MRRDDVALGHAAATAVAAAVAGAVAAQGWFVDQGTIELDPGCQR